MKKILYICILFLSLSSLGYIRAITSQDHKNKVTILRLDKDFYKYILSGNKTSEKDLLSKYSTLLPALEQTIFNTNPSNKLFQNLKDYYSHPALFDVYKNVINTFDNLEKYETELSNMLTLAQKELRIDTVPQFATHISGFKENTIYVNNIISLSLDKYLGKEYPLYKNYFSPFQTQQMSPEFIVRDFTKAWLMASYIKTESSKGNLLAKIIEQGKLLYALHILLPQYSEKDLIGYTTSEIEWCIANQKKVWDYIIMKNQLYSKDVLTISTYFNEVNNSELGYITTNIGGWIGLQIVMQYAEKTKSTLHDILASNEKTILKKSKYRP